MRYLGLAPLLVVAAWSALWQPTCTHRMVQYTLDGGHSTFASFDRLDKRFAVAAA